MAAPSSKTIKDLNGKWLLNKSLSDDPEPFLKVQGISYLTRAALRLATVTDEMKQYTGPPPSPNGTGVEVTYLESIRSASGLKGSKDTRILDNTSREDTDWLFGTTAVQACWVAPADVSDAYLGDGWLHEGDGKTLLLTISQHKEKGWKVTQVNGFQVVSGERHYCARSTVERSGERAELRLVFDYAS